MLVEDIKAQLKFPVSIDVKIVMDKTLDKSLAKKTIMDICLQFNCKPLWKGQKESNGGNYISYTVYVELESHLVFHALYMELGKIDGVKLVL